MTRFATSNDHTTKAGKTLTLKTRDELARTFLAKVVQKDLETALTLLESVDAQLRAKKLSKDLLRYANKLFLTDKKTMRMSHRLSSPRAAPLMCPSVYVVGPVCGPAGLLA